MSHDKINKYLAEYIKLKCCPDLSMNKMWPNAKEITESMGAFSAVRNYVFTEEDSKERDQHLKRKDIKLLSVGDGRTPRTAALFALRTKWDCYSIDPQLNTEKTWPYKRLHLYKNRIDDLKFKFPDHTVIIVMVHSHAKIDITLNSITGKERHLVTIPCCMPHILVNTPYIGYTDFHIASDKNEVKIWRNI